MVCLQVLPLQVILPVGLSRGRTESLWRLKVMEQSCIHSVKHAIVLWGRVDVLVAELDAVGGRGVGGQAMGQSHVEKVVPGKAVVVVFSG